jgi:integrase/recombinase XerD
MERVNPKHRPIRSSPLPAEASSNSEHNLRHSFATRTLVNWYRTGLDPGQEMIKLSTYLGHLRPEHTYWYIEAVPELLELASQRASASLAREVQS